MTEFRCPLAYPLAPPDSASLGAAVRLSCDSSRRVGSAPAAMIRLGKPVSVREALAVHGVGADQVKIWQAFGKLRRRHGLVMSGEPREPGYRVEECTWEARQVRSSVCQG